MSKFEVPDWIREHLDQYIKTNGAAGHLRDFSSSGGKPDTPNLLLTTTGRKSGKSLTMPLIYGVDGDRYVIVASKGGAPEHPHWYQNLLAQPLVNVQIRDQKFRALAITVTGPERERLWKLMVDILPLYDEYVKLTTRQLPVVLLEPVDK